MFTEGFYFYSFDIAMDFFHLESHSITLVKENMNLRFLFFDFISFVMPEVVVDIVVKKTFLLQILVYILSFCTHELIRVKFIFFYYFWKVFSY